MKKLLIIAVSGLLFSCGMSKEEKLIADHEQTIFDSKVDLSFDPLETVLIKKVTAADSAEIIKSWYDSLALKEYGSQSKFFDLYIEQSSRFVDQAYLATGELRQTILETSEEYSDKADSVLTIMNEIEKDHNLGVSESVKQEVKKYEEMGDSPLVEIWECRYKILNPLLQVEQEITRRYLIDLEKTKIIQTL